MTQQNFTPEQFLAQAKPFVELLQAQSTAEGVPKNFATDEGGLYFIEKKDDEEKEKRTWLCSPVKVLGLSRDEDSENWGRVLEFQDPDQKTHQYAVPMELLRGEGTEVIGALLSRGLQIAPGKRNRERLCQFLLQSNTKKRVTSVNHTGWHGQSQFVLPDRVIGNNHESIYFQGLHAQHTAIKTSGGLEEWKREVAARCAGNSRLVFAVSSAFAAPLCALANLETVGFHFFGTSSTGKSTALHVAISVYGSRDYKLAWRATQNGLEEQALRHNDLLMALDELAQAEPREVGNSIYMLCNGSAKARAGRYGGARPVQHWTTRILSSGEIPLSTLMKEAGKRPMAGQSVRLIEMPDDAGAGFGMFEKVHDANGGDAFAKILDAITRKLYGTAGPAFLEKIVAQPDFTKERIKEGGEYFLSLISKPGMDGQVLRVAHQFALSATAGELATHFGLTGWDKGEATTAAKTCFRFWLDTRGGDGKLEDESLIRQVRSFLEAHGESRFPLLRSAPGIDDHCLSKVDDERPTINRAGFRRAVGVDADIYEFVVLPESFKSELCRGFDSRRAGKILAEKGMLRKDSEGKSSVRMRLPGFPNQQRCYIILPTIFADE